MKKVFFLVITCFLVIKVSAQTFPVPENYSLKTKEDYPKYEKDVINTIDWLQQTPWSEQKEQRKIANRFVLQWITGSPTINLEYKVDALTKMCTKNGELLFSFNGGCIKYALQNKDEKDHFDMGKANLAGLKAIISKYQMEPDHIKDKNVENLIKIDKNGKLDEWAKANL